MLSSAAMMERAKSVIVATFFWMSSALWGKRATGWKRAGITEMHVYNGQSSTAMKN